MIKYLFLFNEEQSVALSWMVCVWFLLIRFILATSNTHNSLRFRCNGQQQLIHVRVCNFAMSDWTLSWFYNKKHW